jgi:hypothetical protein
MADSRRLTPAQENALHEAWFAAQGASASEISLLKDEDRPAYLVMLALHLMKTEWNWDHLRELTKGLNRGFGG